MRMFFNGALAIYLIFCSVSVFNAITAMIRKTIVMGNSRANSAKLISEMSDAFEKAKEAKTPKEKQAAGRRIAYLIKRL